MHRFRFSLLAMFAFVAVVAVACAALARPSQLWLVVVSASSLLWITLAVACWFGGMRFEWWRAECNAPHYPIGTWEAGMLITETGGRDRGEAK